MYKQAQVAVTHSLVQRTTDEVLPVRDMQNYLLQMPHSQLMLKGSIDLWQTLVPRPELWSSLGSKGHPLWVWVDDSEWICEHSVRRIPASTHSSIVWVNSLLDWTIQFLIWCFVRLWCNRYILGPSLQWEHWNHFLHQNHIDKAVKLRFVGVAHSNGVNVSVMAALKTSRQYP